MPPACRRRPSELAMNVVWAHHERFLRGFELRRHSAPHPLSAANAKNRVGNAHGGPKPRFRHAHIVIAQFVTKMSDILTQRARYVPTVQDWRRSERKALCSMGGTGRPSAAIPIGARSTSYVTWSGSASSSATENRAAAMPVVVGISKTPSYVSACPGCNRSLPSPLTPPSPAPDSWRATPSK